MPRPKEGYKTIAGDPVPGVHTITGRYADKAGLMHWIYQEGLKGNRNPYASATEIGHAVHKMCELNLRDATDREISAVPHLMLFTPEDIDKAWQSFRAFLPWRQEYHVEPIAFEESLVSEKLRYGGTFDIVAFVDGILSLIDFKTCKDASRVFLDQRVVMAAHANLWQEKHPDMPIKAYHLINLPKDGSKFGHHSFSDLSPEWEMFTLQLDCWQLEQGLTRKRTTKPTTIVPAPKTKLQLVTPPAPVPEASKARRIRKAKSEPQAIQPVITASQAGAVLRRVRDMRPMVPTPVQLVLAGFPSRPVQLSMADLLQNRGEAA